MFFNKKKQLNKKVLVQFKIVDRKLLLTKIILFAKNSQTAYKSYIFNSVF